VAAKGYAVALDELAWVERARRGEEAAFAAIYQRYERRIYAYVYRIMGNPDDAFDLTQETFIKAYQALPRLGSEQELNLSAWLHRIASNTCLDLLRRRRLISWLPWEHEREHGEGVAEPASHDLSGDPESSYVQQETSKQVQNTLHRMSVRNREALVLKEYQSMSCDEIADVMGVSRGAVKSILFRAREEFRKLYNEEAREQ
jgi:RNA polymerase sigma-70 factor, ECF subfamily